MFPPRPNLFDETQIPEQTRAFNSKIIDQLENSIDPWTLPTQVVRDARREGKGIFPLEPFDPKAEVIEAKGPGSVVPLRIIRAETQPARGTFLHIHGGGWMYGAADLQDQRLKQLADETGLDCVSVEYRLTPEHPYPAANEDCEAAAVWLATEGSKLVNTDFLAIGGESAGGHLSVDTLLRLRDKHNLSPFHAAVLIAGIYDLGMTPSAAGFKKRLVLSYRDMVNFSAAYLSKDEDRRSAEVSPLYADLTGMPPAHFTVGTQDALLDDTLFMANVWARKQPDVELDIYPGGCHVFQYFEELEQSQASRSAMAAFLNRVQEQHEQNL